MKLHYKGKYNLDPETLPHGEHKPNCVAFKEAKDTKTLGVVANIISIVILLVLATPIFFRYNVKKEDCIVVFAASVCALLILFPHEVLHAICLKKDAYLYTNWKQGMLFVIGTEDMSKSRFIFMSLLPNLIFGWIPYGIGILFPNLFFFAVFGAFATSMGAGDYYNVFNALTQMPKGARTYLYQFNSYWYFPEDRSES